MFSLHLDESGPFADRCPGARRHTVLVLGGLSLPRHQPSTRLRDRIRAALPGVPWPPHAAHLNRRLFRSAVLLRARELRAQATEVVLEGAGWVEHAEGAEMLRHDLKQDRDLHHLSIESLRQAERMLRREDPGLLERLDGVVKEQQRLVDSLCSALAAEGALAVGATTCGCGGPDAATRYRDAFARLDRALLREGTRPRIWVMAHFGGAPRAPHVITRVPSGMLGRPQHYTADVKPELVLADLLVNRMRRLVLRHPRAPERAFEAWERAGLPPLTLELHPALGGVA